jgi:hypothetical protein
MTTPDHTNPALAALHAAVARGVEQSGAIIEQRESVTLAPRAIEVTLTNEDKGHQFSHYVEPLADTWMGEDATMGELYRAMRDEYGRCMSKVYRDDPEHGEPLHIGWFFESRQRYEDTGEPYLRGAWVIVGE